MRRRTTFLLFLLVMVQCLAQSEKINGVSFVASRDSINQGHVAPVKNIHANYVTLMPFGFLNSLTASSIKYQAKNQWFGETKAGIQQYAHQFQKNKIKVLLKPQIWVARGEFTGFIEMDSEHNWQLLETSYENFILYYATIAYELNVAAFCIGTELEKFTIHRPDFWRKLIRKVRKIYQGKLTYAANWNEFHKVVFWDDLDMIGIDAYFPLTDVKKPTVDDFKLGWKLHKKAIMKSQKQFMKPIVFTEFGYRSIDFTGKEPWNSERIDGQVNLLAQVNGLQAIYDVFWKENWFAGGFVWKWFYKHDEVGGILNNRFTPQNKPAADLLQHLYKQASH